MFETHDSAEIHIPKLFGPDGERVWQYVHLRIHLHWFFVVYQMRDEEGDGRQAVLLLSSAEQLIDISKQDGVKLVQVKVVSPPYMNGSNEWRMEQLKEIRAGFTDRVDPPHEEYVLVLDKQRRYVNLEVEPHALRDERLILKL